MQQAARFWASRLLMWGAALAALVAAFNYFMPGNGISGTYGALLVIASSVALLLVGRMLAKRMSAGIAGFTRNLVLNLAVVVLVLGTAFAAWLLEAYVLFALILLAGLGWLWLLVRPRAA